jgi:GTP-binding protein EngB required for normal cell division
MVNAQEWLDKEYPANRRSEITELDISRGKVKRWPNHERTLKGDLNLRGFNNLRTLKCSGHELTNLYAGGCQYLTNLECQNNQLNSLNINGCSNLEKVNGSNNYISNLDLSTCAKLKEVNLFLNNSLEEIDISNCPKLNKIGFGFTRNKGKLVKVSQTVPAESSVRNILIIGITGNGKSALANTLTNTSKFGESCFGVSATKNFQSSNTFEWEKDGKKAKYRIIDNIGFGDTAKITKADILYKIGEGISSAQEGINQVLFIFRGRFSPEHVKVFNVFKEFVSETGISRFTTLVRTHFENFQTPEECDKDRDALLTQSPEIIEIIDSCNGIVYVDNPAIPKIEEDDDEEIREEKELEISLSGEKREDSRKVVLNHLIQNCSEIYKLKKWDGIYDRVNEYMKQIEEKEQELAKISNGSEKTRLQNEINETKGKIADEVDVTLTAEISAFPKLTAQMQMKNVNIWPFNKK